MAKPKRKVDLLLDSGIFSAWNRGEELKLADYISFVKEHKDHLAGYVGMDSIPGVYGKPRTQKEVEDSAAETYRNQQIMKDAGLSPIPVFHQGERFLWLEKLLKDGEPYVGISSAKDLWSADQQTWLDDIFNTITDGNGRPLVCTHGFGISRPKFLFRYPWHTTDSTTWSLTPGFGSVLVPNMTPDGGTNFDAPPVRIILSGVKQQSSTQQSKQFEALGPLMQAHIRKFLQDEVGITVNQARYGTTHRRRAVLIYYMRLADRIKETRFKNPKGALWPLFQLPSNLQPLKFGRIVVFATNLNREWSDLMNSVDARHRLLSYYELKDKPDHIVEEYVTKGIVNGDYEGRRQPKPDWNSETYLNYRRLMLAERLGEMGEIDPLALDFR